MEDGDDNQRRSQDYKIFSTLADGIDKAKQVWDFANSVINFERIDVKLDRMKRKSEVLEGREKDIKEELKYADSLSLKRPRNEVVNWLKSVDEIKAEVRRVEQQVQESNEKRFPSFQSFQLHGNLDRITAEIVELNGQCEFSRGLTLEAQQSRGLEFLTTRLFGRMFQENKGMILEFLKDDNVLSIGVYGMGGVGKTTLLMHINNELLKNCQDNMSVLWVTVSQEFTIYKLQDDIARALEFSFCEEDVKKRAAELSKFLSRRKNFVLILDDVWKDINLDEIGISLRVNGCKMLLTTRSLDVCRKMDCQKKIKVVPLSVEEAWELFSDKLGDDMELTPGIVEVAKSLVRECDGLPLGIITTARSMKQVDDEYEWKDKLEKMKESKLEHDDMEGKVLQVLKCSYDMLPDPIVQQCFLDCTLYPEDYTINREDLINLFIDERLIDGMKSRQVEIQRGHTILNKLLDACLLENWSQEDIKMHDLVRDMALQITRTNPRFLVQAGLKLNEIPDEDKWDENQNLVKVSFMMNNLSNIDVTSAPRCPKVSTLMLSSNKQLECISDCFFEHMTRLNVLDLSYTNIERLPASTCGLVNLFALLLKGCKRLKSLPSLAKLQALRRLDLSDSGIIELPLGLEVLTKLRYLNLLASCQQIQTGVLAKLVRLQLLRIDLRYVICEELAHLTNLKRLEILEVHLHNVDGLNTFVKSFEEQELVSYEIQVTGDNDQLLSSFNNRKYAKSIIIWESEIHNSVSWDQPLLLPQDIQDLRIVNCNMVRSLSEATSLDKIANLRICVIRDCEGIENLLNASLFHSSPLLQNLETLELEKLKDFRGLINDDGGVSSLPPGTFSSLKFIKISECHGIKKLFTPALISLFQNLERIYVFRCNGMKEIIGASSDGNEEGSSSRGTTPISLPKLKFIYLNVMSDFTSLCDGQTTLVADSLQEIYIKSCPRLQKLSFLDAEVCPFPSLQKIKVKDYFWKRLKWDLPGAKEALRPLCRFM